MNRRTFLALGVSGPAGLHLRVDEPYRHERNRACAVEVFLEPGAGRLTVIGCACRRSLAALALGRLGSPARVLRGRDSLRRLRRAVRGEPPRGPLVVAFPELIHRADGVRNPFEVRYLCRMLATIAGERHTGVIALIDQPFLSDQARARWVPPVNACRALGHEASGIFCAHTWANGAKLRLHRIKPRDDREGAVPEFDILL